MTVQCSVTFPWWVRPTITLAGRAVWLAHVLRLPISEARVSAWGDRLSEWLARSARVRVG